MAEHTKGKAVRDGTIMGPDGTDVDFRLDDDGNNWVTVKGDSDGEAEANARRLSALWNVADDLGLSTDAIEAGKLQELFASVQEMPELNMGYYNDDQVYELNCAAVGAMLAVAALEGEQPQNTPSPVSPAEQ